MKRADNSFSVIVTSHEESEHFFECNLLSSWLVTVTLKEVFTLFIGGQLHYKKGSLSSCLGTNKLKKELTLFMAVYSYTKKSVFSLHGWLQLH
jgi:hypothetical protein